MMIFFIASVNCCTFVCWKTVNIVALSSVSFCIKTTFIVLVVVVSLEKIFFGCSEINLFNDFFVTTSWLRLEIDQIKVGLSFSTEKSFRNSGRWKCFFSWRRVDHFLFLFSSFFFLLNHNFNHFFMANQRNKGRLRWISISDGNLSDNLADSPESSADRDPNSKLINGKYGK